MHKQRDRIKIIRKEMVMKESLKRVLLGVCIVLAVEAIAACGYILVKHNAKKVKEKKEESQEKTMDVDMSSYTEYLKYIELGDYKGISVKKGVPTIDDIDNDTVQDSLEYYLDDYKEYKEVERKVKKGDFINIDFEGKIDGKVDDNASAQDYDIEVGSGDFFDDFEKALVGLKKGKETKLNLKYPKNYDDEDYAGKDVVFTVTVNKIQECTYSPVLTDEFVKEKVEGCNTIDEWKEQIRQEELSYLLDEAEEQVKSDLYEIVLSNARLVNYDELIEKCPELYDEGNSEVQSEYAASAEMFGMTLEEYLEFAGMTQEDLDEEIQLNIKGKLVLAAIIKEENIKLTLDEYEQYIEENYEDNGFESKEEFVEYFTKEEIGKVCLMNKCYEYLLEQADVEEVAYQEYNNSVDEAEIEE